MTAAEQFIHSLQNSTRHTKPWRHWLLDDLFPVDISTELEALPFTPPSEVLNEGRREVNNSVRVFFDAETQAKYPCTAKVVEALRDPRVLSAMESEFQIDLTGSLLRVEYCMDVGDFWLEPHLDLSVKRFTMLQYLSVGEGSDNCGTDVLEVEAPHNLVAEAPFGFNKATAFVPGSDTWHSFHKRNIVGVRKSLIINCVDPSWRARHELTSDVPVK